MRAWQLSLRILPAIFAVIAVAGLVTRVWGFFIPFLIPALQWSGYLFALSRDERRQVFLREFFRLAHEGSVKNPKLIILPIGGAKWIIGNGTFERLGRRGIGRYAHQVTAKDGSDHDSRVGNEKRNQRTRLWQAVILPLLIPLSVLLDYIDEINNTKDWVFLSTVFVTIGLVAPFLVIGWEIAYQRGYQRLWGAMVFDPEPARAERELVEKQKAHGAAGTTEEARVLAAASGSMRRSKVHDQKF